ncbi:AsmA family protein [Mariniphaga anaerophila]|uniref:AsmA family protein n=1 Tax=Mariniphaga anaerophila TaxID=1484053 RepID=A0A1M4TIB8_9BACT|nr:AsmA family protein [Mariniphaga anaerophila]SHE44074.1 AsmA family protein [Mariniphaga anaerophila]
MKKALIIIGIVVALLVASLAVIPLFFKQPLLEKTKTTINNNVNAKVEFTDFKLSLLRSFPKVTLELTNVVVVGKGEFQNDTLCAVPSLRTKTGIGQLFSKDGVAIEEIILDRPELKLIVGTTGNANWDIALESDEPEETAAAQDAAGEESGLELQLEKIKIEHANFVYDDRDLNMLFRLDDINFDISGKMYGSAAQLLLEGGARQLLFNYEGANYVSNTSVETRTMLNIDYDKMDIEIQENELLINRLPLEILGLIQMPDSSMNFDLTLNTKKSGFDNFLALVPPDYEEYLKDIQTSGNATISGAVKGIYSGENYPAFTLNLKVDNGNLRYADLPEEVKNISADLSVAKPQGELDLTEVNIAKAHAEVKNSPVDLTLKLKNLFTDPWFDGALVGNVNFDDLKDALPMDSVDIAGTVDANLFVKGNYSAIENEEYEKIQSDGTVLLSGFIYSSPSLTQQVLIPEGKLDFSPRAVTLSELGLKVGQSDFRLSGQVTNYLNYLLKDGTLAGKLRLNSNFVNLNELLRLQVAEQEPEAETPAENKPAPEIAEQEVLAFDIPQNIDFTFQSKIERAVFERLPITNINGLITARNGKLALDGLNMNMLDGEMKLSGSYQNTPENQPFFDFGFDLIKVDIPKAYQTLVSIQKMIPIARQSQGKFSTSLKVNGQMSPEFKLLAPTVDGSGLFSTESLQIVGSPLFNQLKGILKSEKLNDVKVDDFKAFVEVVDGSIQLKPFSTRIADQETTISGNLNTENLLNMRLDFNVQRDAFGNDIQNILSVLPGQERIQLIPASVVLNGPVGKPEVKIDLEKARKMITEEVKKSTKENLQQNLNKIGEGLRKFLK